MNANQITSIVISILFVILFLCYILSCQYVSKDLVILGLSILFIIAIFMSFMNTCAESFYFEVSPQRKKCLMEQVSTAPGNRRGCACCQKGTVGGYPPNYSQWLEPEPYSNSLWKRADNWTTNSLDVTGIPPVQFVEKEEQQKRKVQRTLV